MVQIAEPIPSRDRRRPSALDEAAARRALRAQVARLERELAACGAAAAAAVPRSWGPAATGPRLLGLGDLETTRDDLVGRLGAARRELARRADEIARSRTLLERMRSEPRLYKFTRVTQADLGQPGCGVWHVRPRLGLVGMLAGWWQIKLSSGCPLPP